jgi:hypothetical protein
MTLPSQKEYLKPMRLRYKKARTKAEKTTLISEVCSILSVHRKHAIRLLNQKPTRHIKKSVGKQETYGQDLCTPLRRLWEVAGHPCSKRLHAQISTLLDTLIRFKEIEVTPSQDRQLREMSNWTINKLLAYERLKKKGEGLSGTRTSPLLKTLIPIRTDFHEVTGPGHIELDCVLHCGESMSGSYAETVNLIDIHTHWNEKGMILNKTKQKVISVVHGSRKSFPFPLLSLDFDNGTEFVNWHLYNYCKREQISFTRSRSYHKNDQAHIEGKNFHSVRKVMGYDRIESEQIVDLVNEVYRNEIRLLTNFFYPTFKLIEKDREGGKVTKRYEVPRTPYERVMSSDTILKEKKDALRDQYLSLNPAQLQRSLKTKMEKIFIMISVTFPNLATTPSS